MLNEELNEALIEVVFKVSNPTYNLGKFKSEPNTVSVEKRNTKQGSNTSMGRIDDAQLVIAQYIASNGSDGFLYGLKEDEHYIIAKLTPAELEELVTKFKDNNDELQYDLDENFSFTLPVAFKEIMLEVQKLKENTKTKALAETINKYLPRIKTLTDAVEIEKHCRDSILDNMDLLKPEAGTNSRYHWSNMPISETAAYVIQITQLQIMYGLVYQNFYKNEAAFTKMLNGNDDLLAYMQTSTSMAQTNHAFSSMGKAIQKYKAFLVAKVDEEKRYTEVKSEISLESLSMFSKRLITTGKVNHYTRKEQQAKIRGYQQELLAKISAKSKFNNNAIQDDIFKTEGNKVVSLV